MDNINFKKVLDDGELFDQQANYEENFEKINQEVVPKITELQDGKVDKVTGKGLSTNDYTTMEKNKLAGIPADTAAQLADIEQKQGLLSGLLTTAKTSIVAAINELFNNKANKAQEGWIAPTLLNGATFDTNDPFRYRKNQIGTVECKGKINVISGDAVLIFPVGYRTNSLVLKRYPIVKEGSPSTVSWVTLQHGSLYLASGLHDMSAFRFIAEG